MMKRRVSHLANVVISFFALLSASIVCPASANRKANDPIAKLNPLKSDFMLNVLSDGTVQFKDRSSNEVLWSLQTGPSIYSLYRDEKSNFDYIDCGDDGELYRIRKDGKMHHLGVTTDQFMNHEPYISEDGGVTLGSRATSVFTVDAKSGRLVRTHGFSVSTSIIQHGNGKDFPIDSNFGQLVEPSYMEGEDVEHPFFVTRTDYTLETFDPKSSKALSKMTVAHIGAVFLCPRLEPNTRPYMRLACNVDVNVYHSYRPSIYLEPSTALAPAPSDGFALAYISSEGLSTPKPEDDNETENNYQPNDSTLHSFVALSMLPKVFVTVCAVSLFLAMFVLLISHVASEEVELGNQSKKKKKRKSGKKGSAEKMDRLLSENDSGSAQGLNATEPLNGLNRPGNNVVRRIGRLCVSTVEIGKGSNGTVVLEGRLDGRPVAVKRLVLAHYGVAFKEIDILRESDQHPNIVRWYGVEYDRDFVYLSLERCTCNLDDLIQICSNSSQDEDPTEQSVIEYKGGLDSVKVAVRDVHLWKTNGYPSALLLRLMRDVVSGIVHLHGLGIIHRDLKPRNVLIIKENFLRVKISDMGISKRLHENMSSLGYLATGCGSSGWQAPEQLLLQGRQTRAVDMFSLGCVLFFCISGGRHPFGDHLERDINIVKNKVDIYLVEAIPEAVDLFSRLLNPDPESRPKAEEVLCHPLFWNSEKRLSFLCDTSDRVQLKVKGTSDILSALESAATMALGGKWDEKMEPAFINNIKQYRRYKYNSLQDLLRVIRNKLNHYRELPEEIKELLGPIPEGYSDYFTSRFPKLVTEVYKVMQQHCRKDECFLKYFEADNSL